MSKNGRFGAFFKQKRLDLGKTLRQFCRENGFDPGNLSKVERGILPPPQGETQRRKYAMALGIAEGSDDWLQFHDFAAAETGRLPQDLLDDESVTEELPLFFRTIRNEHPSKEDLRSLVEAIKRES